MAVNSAIALALPTSIRPARSAVAAAGKRSAKSNANPSLSSAERRLTRNRLAISSAANSLIRRDGSSGSYGPGRRRANSATNSACFACAQLISRSPPGHTVQQIVTGQSTRLGEVQHRRRGRTRSTARIVGPMNCARLVAAARWSRTVHARRPVHPRSQTPRSAEPALRTDWREVLLDRGQPPPRHRRGPGACCKEGETSPGPQTSNPPTRMFAQSELAHVNTHAEHLPRPCDASSNT